MDDKTFFDKIAENWDANEVLSTPDKVEYILDFFDVKPGMEVLDLGSGTGVLLPYLALKVGKEGKIVAVDFSEGMLCQAIKKFSALSPTPLFINLDFEKENIPGEFDRIILYCVYPHLHEPVETLKWLLKVNLKENGAIYIAFPCAPDFINNIHKERHSESDILPSASSLVEHLRDNNLNAEVLKDDENAYIIRIKK